ncbi:MAG: hypothetical protein AAFO04_06465 [Cyanobacteria bacterium J06592_8]
MQYEDTKILNAFMTAALRLENSLPDDIRSKLDQIAERFPDSIWELRNLAKHYKPLEQEYKTARQEMPSEGERLKSPESESIELIELTVQEPTVGWDEVERRLGTTFLDMVLDMIERSHPEYDRKMAEALEEGLAELNSGNCTVLTTAEEIDDWLDKLFDTSDEEL